MVLLFKTTAEKNYLNLAELLLEKRVYLNPQVSLPITIYTFL